MKCRSSLTYMDITNGYEKHYMPYLWWGIKTWKKSTLLLYIQVSLILYLRNPVLMFDDVDIVGIACTLGCAFARACI